MLYASYIGGAGIDRGKGIAVDDNGDIYITGETDANSAQPFSADVEINSLATIDGVETAESMLSRLKSASRFARISSSPRWTPPTRSESAIM